MFLKKLALAGAVTVLSGTTALAGCGLSAGNVSILGNDFAAIQAVVAGARECAGDGVSVSANLTTEHRDLQVAALTANPAQYSSAIVANSSIVPLLNDGLIRPLDDLVAKHGQALQPSQLITIDGKVMAVAFMANAQHLFYRSDVLAAAGVQPPSSYDDVLAAAAKIKSAGLMDHPVILNTKTGWNLGEEFVNMYMGTGAPFFKAGTAEVAINNEHGVAALNMLKSLTEYSNPDYLTYDSNATAAVWEAGQAALGIMWGSRGGPILDDEGSTEEVTGSTVLTGAPTLMAIMWPQRSGGTASPLRPMSAMPMRRRPLWPWSTAFQMTWCAPIMTPPFGSAPPISPARPPPVYRQRPCLARAPIQCCPIWACCTVLWARK